MDDGHEQRKTHADFMGLVRGIESNKEYLHRKKSSNHAFPEEYEPVYLRVIKHQELLLTRYFEKLNEDQEPEQPEPCP